MEKQGDIMMTVAAGMMVLILLIFLSALLNVQVMWLVISLGFIILQSILNVYIGKKISKWYESSVDLKPRLENVEERVKSISYFLNKNHKEPE